MGGGVGGGGVPVRARVLPRNERSLRHRGVGRRGEGGMRREGGGEGSRDSGEMLKKEGKRGGGKKGRGIARG